VGYHARGTVTRISHVLKIPTVATTRNQQHRSMTNLVFQLKLVEIPFTIGMLYNYGCFPSSVYFGLMTFVPVPLLQDA